MQARETAQKILKNAKQEEKERQALLKQKEEEQRKKLEEAFERDRAHLKEKADKGSKYA